MTTQAVSAAALLAEHGLTDATLSDVASFITRQRWSGAQDTQVAQLDVADAAVVVEADATIIFTILRVTYVDGRVREYALPLGLRPAGDVLAERAPTFMIGSVGGDSGSRILYDALGDPAYVHWLWQAIRRSLRIPTARGELRCECADPSRLEDEDTPWMRVLTVEQSNTSIEIGQGTFLKHLRRVEPGPSQELEMTGALTASGFAHIAPMLADVMYVRDGGESSPLVLVQPYLRNSSDGWALALTSLRDLYADAEEALAVGDVDAVRVVDEQGGAFIGEAERLGSVVGEMHVTLARAKPESMRAQPMTPADLQRWAADMSAELDSLLRAGGDAIAVARSGLEQAREAFSALPSLRPGGLCTRVHGDLHLGQTLRVDTGWVILDFEGEPDRTPAERRQLSSPLRDVAGMLRSFDYAAAVALTDRVMPDSADWDGMMAFGDEWAVRNRRAFWNAYLSAVEGANILPPLQEALVLRRAFELQKAVYEARYELGHRPTWVAIPLRFLQRSPRDARD